MADSSSRIRHRSTRKTKYILLATAGAFIVYCLLWYGLTKDTEDDPIFQVKEFLNQFSKKRSSGLPSRLSFDTVREAIQEADHESFDLAVAILEAKDYKKAGRLFWPLAAKYPFIRPSVAYGFYKIAKENSIRGANKETLKFLDMAFAFYDRGVRENTLASRAYLALNNREKAQQYNQYANDNFPRGLRAKVDPPSTTLIFFFVFILTFSGIGAYYYWTELALVDKAMAIYAKLTGKALPKKPSIQRAGLPVDTFPGAPTPVPPTPKLEAEALSNILAAEDFLKEVKDFFDQKNYELGVDLCQKAIELNPANAKKVASLCLQEGSSLYELCEYDQARDLLEVALHYDPHNAQAHILMGNVHIKKGDFQKAKEQYEQVIGITPKNADAYYTLGVCYQKCGDLGRAKRSFEVAVKLNDHVNSHFYLAKIAEANENVQEAIDNWERFVKVGADSPQAAQAKERIVKLKALLEGPAQEEPAE